MFKFIDDIAVTAESDVFKHLRDAVCSRNGIADYTLTGLGWTLYDAVYAVDENTISTYDYVILHTTTETGDDELYFKLEMSASNKLKITAYLSWDATSHTGSAYYVYKGTQYVAADSIIRICGDLDEFYCLIDRPSTPARDLLFAGRISNPSRDRTVVRGDFTTIDENYGKLVMYSSTLPSSWKVGRVLVIRRIHRATICKIESINGNELIVSYADTSATDETNVKVSEDWSVMFFSGYYLSSTDIRVMLQRDDLDPSAGAGAISNFLLGSSSDVLTDIGQEPAFIGSANFLTPSDTRPFVYGSTDKVLSAYVGASILDGDVITVGDKTYRAYDSVYWANRDMLFRMA